MRKLLAALFLLATPWVHADRGITLYDSATNYFQLKTPTTISRSYQLIVPLSAGTTNQMLGIGSVSGSTLNGSFFAPAASVSPIGVNYNGVSITSPTVQINFTGAGVSVAATGSTATVTIVGGGGGGGSGASTLGVTTGSASGYVGPPVSTPTFVIVFDSVTTNGQLRGGATYFFTINTASITAQGNSIRLSTLQASVNSLGVDTGTVNADLQSWKSTVATSTNTLQTNINLVGSDTGTINSALQTWKSTVASSTNTLQTNINSVGSSTGSLKTRIDNLDSSTATLTTRINAVASDTGTINSDLQTWKSTVATSTGTLQTNINAVGVDTGTLKTRVDNLDSSTATLTTRANAIAVDTGTLRTSVTNLGVDTATLKTSINSVGSDTGTLKASIVSLGTDTGTLKTSITSIGSDTGTLKGLINSVGSDTGTLKTSINSVGSDTGTLRSFFPVSLSTAVTNFTTTSSLTVTGAAIKTTFAVLAASASFNAFDVTPTSASVGGSGGLYVKYGVVISTMQSDKFNVTAASASANFALLAGTVTDNSSTSHGVAFGGGTSAPLTYSAAGSADTLLQGQGASSNASFVAVNNCGDSSHALSYNTSTHAFGCQSVTGSAGSPGGSSGQLQYNNSSSFGGVTGSIVTSSSITYTGGVQVSTFAIVAPAGNSSSILLSISTSPTNANTVSISSVGVVIFQPTMLSTAALQIMTTAGVILLNVDNNIPVPTDYLLNVSSQDATHLFGVQNNGNGDIAGGLIVGGATAPSTSTLFAVTSATTTTYEQWVGTGTATFHIAVSTSGHAITYGPPPTISSCGSTPNGSVVGDDNQGTITVGGGSVTACTLTFANTWGATPTCTISDSSTALTPDISAISATAFTASMSASLGGGSIYYRCGCSGLSCR